MTRSSALPTMLPLDDMLVLDLTQAFAGPFATKVLADYGADVIKIEPPGSGDPARQFGPFPGGIPHPEKSGIFLHLNTNKRGTTLDLTQGEGRDLFLRLAAQADVVMESFSPGVMERLGLSWADLEAVNPRLVMTSLSNFGQTGPYREYKASEITLYALGGPMQTTGLPDREPVKLGGRVTLYQGGYIAAAATLTAFLGARWHGQGQYVDVAIYETAAGSMDRRLTNILVYQFGHERLTRQRATGAGFPSGYYPCADGYFSITGGGLWFPRSARMMGMPELAHDPRFCTPEAQVDPARREEFELEYFLPWTLAHTKEECVAAGQANDVLCGAVNTVEDVLASPHVQARAYFVEADHPVAGRLKYTGAPFKMSASPYQFRRPAPLLGQHTDEVLRERLGLTDADLAHLRQRGVI